MVEGVTTMREMLEMRYLWRKPLRLDNRKLVAFLGEERQFLGIEIAHRHEPRQEQRPPRACPQKGLAEGAGGTTLVLYSEGGGTWFPAGTNFLPGDRPAASEPYQLGWDTLDTIFDRLEAVGVDGIVSRPYQKFTVGGGVAGWAAARPHATRY